MRTRLSEYDLARCLQTNPEIPVKITFGLCLLISQPSLNNLSRNMIHVTRSNSTNHMKLIESARNHIQLLQINQLHPNFSLWRNVPHLQVENILTVTVNCSVSSLFSLTNCLLVLLLSLLLLLYHSLNSSLPKLSHKFINTSFRIDRKIVLHL